MATETAYRGDDPRRRVSNARGLARQVRKEQRATWFPLLLFAALSFAFIPVVRYGGHHMDCSAWPGGRDCKVYSNAEFVYWPIALVLGYAAIVAFYIRRSWARGVGTRVRQYAIAGVILAVALTGVALWGSHNPPVDQNPMGLSGLPDRLASPGAAVGLALLVLAWAERNRALLLPTFAYLTAVLAPVTSAAVQHGTPWYSLPLFFQGSLLLLGAIGFALARGHSGRSDATHGDPSIAHGGELP